MKPFVKFIGVVDKNKRNHSVEFKQGLNIVTGKSSTGKSALIEIYDYCFGSSDFNVPVGIITEVSDFYYVVLQRGQMLLVLGRKPNSSAAFIKEVDEIPMLEEKPAFTPGWFEEGYFIHIDNYKKELGYYFGLNINDVSLDEDEKIYRGKRKPSPSIRSFTSFNLQHQNLIANKHALFYRFDQREKREQAIEHLKIFLGFVDQKYFSKSQELNALEKRKKIINASLPKKNLVLEKRKAELRKRLDEYRAVTGKHLVEVNVDLLLNNPVKWLEQVKKMQIDIDSGSTVNHETIINLEGIRRAKNTALRKEEEELRGVQASIAANESYFKSIASLNYPRSIDEKKSVCPMCDSRTDTLVNEANMLEEAVNWLNVELSKSEPISYSYESKRKTLQDSVEKKRIELRALDEELLKIKLNNEELKKRSSLVEQAMKAKLFVELYLEDLLTQANSESTNSELNDIEIKLKNLKDELKKYPVDQMMAEAENYLNEAMNQIGQNFDFEPSFSLPNLQFSFETFDLWYKKGNDKVFLRSMGSGANWLYCHLSLFLAFTRLFCKYAKTCVIPPILFIDQPSQVYFPNVTNDLDDYFKPSSSAKKDRVQSVDEDIQSVQKFFDEMIRFCESTKTETGLLPQLIVTDHADNLKLSNHKSFDEFVRARWRGRGFIS